MLKKENIEVGPKKYSFIFHFCLTKFFCNDGASKLSSYLDATYFVLLFFDSFLFLLRIEFEKDVTIQKFIFF